MATATQDEADRAADQLRDAPDGLPGHQVILCRRHGIHVLPDGAQINGHALDDYRAVLDQAVAQAEVAQVEGVGLLVILRGSPWLSFGTVQPHVIHMVRAPFLLVEASFPATQSIGSTPWVQEKFQRVVVSIPYLLILLFLSRMNGVLPRFHHLPLFGRTEGVAGRVASRCGYSHH
jgi:hypothetical protein